MLSEHDRSILLDFHRRMAEHGVPVIRMVLFGSCARGEADEYSDLDVLVVVEKKDKEVLDAVERCAWEAEFGPGVLLQPVVITPEEMTQSPLRSSLLLQAVEREGIQVT